MLRRARRLIFLLACVSLFFALSPQAFSQGLKNFSVGFTTGGGHTFTQVGSRDANNKYNYLKGRFGPSILIGINLRYALIEGLSIQTGAKLVSRGYRATYSSEVSESFSSSWFNFPWTRFGFTQHREADIILPIQCIGRIALKRDRLYASFIGGPALDIMIRPNSFTEYAEFNHKSSLSLWSNSDSAASAYYALGHPRTRVQAMLVLGIGMEKTTKNRCTVGFSLVSYTGFKKVFTGDFYFYDTPIYDPEPSVYHPFQNELPPQTPSEHAKVFSRNTSIMLEFNFLFATNKENRSK